MHRPEQDRSLAEQVRNHLRLERRLERVWRAERDRPAERDVCGATVEVLLHRKAGVDARAVDLAALLVKPAHGRTHALRADRDHVDVRGELLARGLEVPEQESVRQAECRARLQRVEDLPVQLRLRRIGDEEDGEVVAANYIEHVAQRAVLLCEAGRPSVSDRLRALAQPDDNLDASALERFAQVLRLRRALRAPADDADLLDARERLRQQAEQVPAAAKEALLHAVELDRLHVEETRLELVGLAFGAGGRAHSAAG